MLMTPGPCIQQPEHLMSSAFNIYQPLICLKVTESSKHDMEYPLRLAQFDNNQYLSRWYLSWGHDLNICKKINWVKMKNSMFIRSKLMLAI